jgi:hypothetical protein
VEPVERTDQASTNGAALAAYLAAGIGALAMGLFVILNEADVFTAPSLYAPAGGVSGRTTFAVVAWLIAWGVLHRLWNGRQRDSGRVHVIALLLIALGALLTFPPVWRLF